MQDVHNIALLEHVNINVPSRELATEFFLRALFMTQDPYENTGRPVMWINIGGQQIHLPVLPNEPAQRLDGEIGIVVPDIQEVIQYITETARHGRLSNSQFKMNVSCGPSDTNAVVRVTGPYGNRYRLYEPDWDLPFGAEDATTVLTTVSPARASLGIAYVEQRCAQSTSAHIAAFYSHYLMAKTWAIDGGGGCVVLVGPAQFLVYRECSADDSTPVHYDGTHLCIYICAFTECYDRLKRDSLIWSNPRFTTKCDEFVDAVHYSEFRFKSLVNPTDTTTVHHTMEHEVRSLAHPSFMRPLINRPH